MERTETTEEVTIEKLVYGGSGLGRLHGQVVFVPYTAPGDRALVTIEERKRDYLTGRLESLVQAGEGRREAPCPYFQDCGGCQLQHLDAATQEQQKRAMLAETLARGLSGLPLPDVEFVSGPELAYRRNVRYQLSDQQPPAIGFYRARSRQVVDIERCPLLLDTLNDAYARLRASDVLARFQADQVAGIRAVHSRRQQRTVFAVLGKGGARGEEPPVMAYLTDDGQAVSLLEWGEPAEEYIQVSLAGRDFQVHPLSFFQSNVHLSEDLVRLVLEGVRGLDQRSLAVELYCGNGLFTIPMARDFERVVAVEQDARSLQDGSANGTRNEVHNVEWVHAAADAWVEGPGSELNPAVLLVDPPREGLSKSVSQWALERRPQHIVYVSCSPPTLARDLKRWAAGGAYRVQRVVGVDLFPQTFHVEAVVVLEACDAGRDGSDADEYHE